MVHDKFLYTQYDQDLYERFISSSTTLRLLYPTIRSAYIAGLLTKTIPYEKPRLRIELIGHGVRMFEVDPSSTGNWRYTLLSEVKQVFKLQKAVIRSEDGSFTFNAETPIDFFVSNGLRLLVVEALPENEVEDIVPSEGQSVSLLSLTPRDSSEPEEEGEDLTNTESPRSIDVEAPPLSVNLSVFNDTVKVFFEDLLYTTLEQDALEEIKDSPASIMYFVLEACQKMPFSYNGRQITMEEVFENSGELNFGYFVYRATQVFRRAIFELVKHRGPVDTSKYPKENLVKLNKRLSQQVSSQFVPALTVEVAEKAVSVSNEPIVGMDTTLDGSQDLQNIQTEPLQQHVNSVEDMELEEAMAQTETPPSPQGNAEEDEEENPMNVEGKYVDKVLSAGGTLVASVANQLTKSRFVTFSIDDRSSLKNLLANVEPGQILNIHVKALGQQRSLLSKPSEDPEWILVRIAESTKKLKGSRGRKDKDERFCCSWKLRRNATGFSVPFTIPIHNGSYRVHVYVPSSGGNENIWKLEGTSKFRVASIGSAFKTPVTWKVFEDVIFKAKADETLAEKLYITDEIQNGRVAGEWPSPAALNGETTFSATTNSDQEIRSWVEQTAEQQVDALSNYFINHFVIYARGKRDRIIRAIYCVFRYNQTGNPNVDVSSVTTNNINDGVRMDEEEGGYKNSDYSSDDNTEALPVQATILIAGNTYDTNDFPDDGSSINTTDDVIGPATLGSPGSGFFLDVRTDKYAESPFSSSSSSTSASAPARRGGRSENRRAPKTQETIPVDEDDSSSSEDEKDTEPVDANDSSSPGNDENTNDEAWFNSSSDLNNNKDVELGNILTSKGLEEACGSWYIATDYRKCFLIDNFESGRPTIISLGDKLERKVESYDVACYIPLFITPVGKDPIICDAWIFVTVERSGLPVPNANLYVHRTDLIRFNELGWLPNSFSLTGNDLRLEDGSDKRPTNLALFSVDIDKENALHVLGLFGSNPFEPMIGRTDWAHVAVVLLIMPVGIPIMSFDDINDVTRKLDFYIPYFKSLRDLGQNSIDQSELQKFYDTIPLKELSRIFDSQPTINRGHYENFGVFLQRHKSFDPVVHKLLFAPVDDSSKAASSTGTGDETKAASPTNTGEEPKKENTSLVLSEQKPLNWAILKNLCNSYRIATDPRKCFLIDLRNIKYNKAIFFGDPLDTTSEILTKGSYGIALYIPLVFYTGKIEDNPDDKDDKFLLVDSWLIGNIEPGSVFNLCMDAKDLNSLGPLTDIISQRVKPFTINDRKFTFKRNTKYNADKGFSVYAQSDTNQSKSLYFDGKTVLRSKFNDLERGYFLAVANMKFNVSDFPVEHQNRIVSPGTPGDEQEMVLKIFGDYVKLWEDEISLKPVLADDIFGERIMAVVGNQRLLNFGRNMFSYVGPVNLAEARVRNIGDYFEALKNGKFTPNLNLATTSSSSEASSSGDSEQSKNASMSSSHVESRDYKHNGDITYEWFLELRRTGTYVTILPFDSEPLVESEELPSFLDSRTFVAKYERGAIRDGNVLEGRFNGKQLSVTLHVRGGHDSEDTATISERITKKIIDDNASVRFEVDGAKKILIMVFTDASF